MDSLVRVGVEPENQGGGWGARPVKEGLTVSVHFEQLPGRVAGEMN